MPRKKISEYRAKNLVNGLLGLKYEGWSILKDGSIDNVKGKRFVVKADQAIKQRFKKGLIYLDIPRKDLSSKVQELRDKGYDSILIEPYFPHDGGAERYISLRRERSGVVINFSKSGGVEIESHTDSIQGGKFDDIPLAKLGSETGFSETQLNALRQGFDDLYLSYLEVNPYIVQEGEVKILDAAVEVDSSAELLVDAWNESDMRSPVSQMTNEEEYVRKLNRESPASFSLDLINPDGSIFLLLSGGGASVVIADEIFTLGYGDQLANYGEYSGNPTEDETYSYTVQLIELMLRSKAPKKVALIGGAVANFTDIAATFKGIIAALKQYQNELTKQPVKFYVRRGGPRQAEGLAMIEKALRELGILGGVYDPATSIPKAVSSIIEGLK